MLITVTSHTNIGDNHRSITQIILNFCVNPLVATGLQSRWIKASKLLDVAVWTLHSTSMTVHELRNMLIKVKLLSTVNKTFYFIKRIQFEL